MPHCPLSTAFALITLYGSDARTLGRTHQLANSASKE
jgi:hypothetical protein